VALCADHRVHRIGGFYDRVANSSQGKRLGVVVMGSRVFLGRLFAVSVPHPP